MSAIQRPADTARQRDDRRGGSTIEAVETIGPAELLIILAVVLLLFGSKKLPELARGMGQAATEFRKGLRSSEETASAAEADPEPKST